MSLQEPLYIAFPYGAGIAYAPRVGNTVSPAPRSYKSAIHAQLANPTGKLYVIEIVTDEHVPDLDLIAVVAQAGFYPLDLLETKVPGVGCNAEGAWTLRDFGPGKDHRWVIHFRNDQLGGYHNGSYFSTFDEAVAAYAEQAAKTLARIAALSARQVETA